MNIRHLAPLFFTLCVSVSYSQDKPKTDSAAGSHAPVVSNFPSRERAQRNWDKQEPREASPAEAGPSTAISPGGAAAPGGGTVTSNPLPSPKIDYVGETLERAAPMTPKEIRRFSNNVYERSIEGARVPGGPYSMRGMRQVTLDLTPNPDRKPETIQVGLGLGAKVSFIDRTGAPVIIDELSGHSDAFNAFVLESEQVKKTGSHVFTVEPSTLVGQGNVSVQLVGVNTPIIIGVEVGKSRVVDSVVQFVVPIAPKPKFIPGDRHEADAAILSPQMQGFLAGIPPEDAVEVKVLHAGNTRGWMWNKHLYLRTGYDLLTPGFFRRQASSDGTTVYELPLTPVVTLGVEGREVRAVVDFPYIPANASRAVTNPK